MSALRGDGGELSGELLEEIRRLRREGAGSRGAASLGGREDPEPPLTGWAPILDDEGNVYGEPPPAEPTDAPDAPPEKNPGGE